MNWKPSIRVLLGIALGLLISRYVLLPLVPTYLSPEVFLILAVILTVFVLPIAVSVVSSIIFLWYQTRSEKTGKWREKHKKDILEVLKANIESLGKVEYTPDGKINKVPLKWTESEELYPNLISHLQSYGGILETLTQAKDYSDNCIEKISNHMQELNVAVEAYLQGFAKQFPTMIAKDSFIGYNTQHYNRNFLRYLIYEDIKSKLKTNSPRGNIRVTSHSQPQLTVMEWNGTPVAVGYQALVGGLHYMTGNIENDHKVWDIINSIIKLEEEIQTNQALRNFETQRKEIVKELKYGKVELKGKCKLCSP